MKRKITYAVFVLLIGCNVALPQTIDKSSSIKDGTDATKKAAVMNSNPAGTEQGLVTRPIAADPPVISGNITAADAGSTTPASLVSGQSLITGTATANSTVSASLSGTSSYSVQLSGTWIATVQFEKSADGGATWESVGMSGVGSSTSVTTLTGAGANANAVLHGNSANITNVRVRCTAFTSGTVAVKIQPSYGVFTVLSATNEADGANVTLGLKADAKSTATDATPVSAMSVFKEISFMEQNPAARPVTESGNWTMRLQGSAGAIIDFAGQNAAAPANAFLIGGEFNTTPTTITNGNASPLQMDANGNLLIKLNVALPAGTNVIGHVIVDTAPSTAVTNGGTFPVQAAQSGNYIVGGVTANNVAITENPLNLGAQAATSENPAITATRKAQLVSDAVGKLIVLPYANPENFVSGAITTSMTGTTTTSLLAAPASGLRNYITQITVSNAHATVGTDVIIQDGSGGTTLYTIPAAAAYGGAVITFPTPLRQPTTATAIFCANVTTGASTKVSASGYKGQ